MKSILISVANIVNEGQITPSDILVKDGFIFTNGHDLSEFEEDLYIDSIGKHVFPEIIGDQVHFRKPGPTCLIVSGHLEYENSGFHKEKKGMYPKFSRKFQD